VAAKKKTTLVIRVLNSYYRSKEE